MANSKRWIACFHMEIVDLIIRIDCFRVPKEAVEVRMGFLGVPEGVGRDGV